MVNPNSDKQCLGRLLKEWLKSYPGNSRGSTSFATNIGLKLALVKAGLGAVACDLPTYQDIITPKHLDITISIELPDHINTS